MLKRSAIITTSSALILTSCGENESQPDPTAPKSTTPITAEKVVDATNEVVKKVEDVTQEAKVKVAESTKKVTEQVEVAKEKVADVSKLITGFSTMNSETLEKEVSKYDIPTLKNVGTKLKEMITAQTGDISKLTDKIKNLGFGDLTSAAALKDQLSKLIKTNETYKGIYTTVATQLKSLGVTIPTL